MSFKSIFFICSIFIPSLLFAKITSEDQKILQSYRWNTLSTQDILKVKNYCKNKNKLLDKCIKDIKVSVKRPLPVSQTTNQNNNA